MKSSDHTQVLTFLKAHVIGKAVVAAPLATHTDQEQMEGVYEDQTFFSNLSETAGGFCFDLTVIARGELHNVDKSGKRMKPEGTLNAVRVYRYHMTERKSSGKLVGFARFVASTGLVDLDRCPDPFSGTVFLARMWLEGDELVVQESQTGYADVISSGGVYKPVATDGKYRYIVKDEQLEVQYQQVTYSVHPDTLQRTATGEHFPVQISKELGLNATHQYSW